MKRMMHVMAIMVVLLTCSIAAGATTAFTYQGELQQNGSPANGTHDLRFTLWNALSGGTQQGAEILKSAVPVTNGRFTVELDFGSDVFLVGDRWLQIRVDATTLSPRQPISPSPFSIKTRGIYVNNDESFVGVGRSYRITLAEAFGIHKNTSAFGGMYVETAADGEPFYGYSRNGTVDAYHYFDTASNQWRLDTGGTRMVVSRTNGDVGIGTTSPTHPLHVVGSDSSAIIWATNNANDGNAITGQCGSSGSSDPAVSGINGGVNGVGLYGYCWSLSGLNYGVYGASNSTSGYDFYAGGAGTNYGSSSSRRWKNNVLNIPQPLEKIARLRGVYFDWDKAHGGHHDVGMIAEEVGAVLPEIVVYEANGVDAQGMDYSKLTPLLVEAVNALRDEKDAEIEDLQMQLEELKTTVAQLQALIKETEQ